ncbi:EAL domain-containing protein [Cupriavidus sp. WKF15]|uniref:putative bifunctional diguanylate cyclase/phosphodiesterase n=1 Tax=Cupriavidus sp. WKF15 TaxID=3032282 RepID=UPI0023E28913|nr:EAL domain-containing protein [Cupriavidus sp. WKF15]WER47536.1 EAL domain-containing protein [Cupriavidus sp. WKF15]
MTSFTYDAVQAGNAREPVRSGGVAGAVTPAGNRDAWTLLEAWGGLALQVSEAGNILQATSASADLLAFPREYLLHASIKDIIAFDERERAAHLLQACFQDGLPKQAEIRFANAITGTRWIDLRVCRHVKADGQASLLLFGADVTKWAQKLHRLTEQSLTDPLTGVGNRGLIRNRVEAYFACDAAERGRFAIALMDLDGFKKVNDSLGHEVGDILLKELSLRLAGTLRSRDTIARLGGDEFVILLHDVTSEETAAGMLEQIMRVCRQPFHLAGCQVRVTTSIGLAFASGVRETEAQLLRRADRAMYEAKAQGNNRYCLYSPELDRRLNEQFRIEQDLFEAVLNGELFLHYQPIFRVGPDTVCAVEALMRWDHRSGAISPEVFVPLAESNGLINHLGAWAVRCACAQLAAWDANGVELGYVSVNVSPVQFRHPGFVDSVRSAIRDTGIDPHRLVLEITEGALMTDPKVAGDLLTELRALGIRFAVDDFGTGYSSLSYLRRFPLSALKIDRSFVADMVDSPHARTIVSAVLSLARELGLVAIAEGVETDAQCDLLAAQRCELGQGWRFARAMSPNDFEDAVREGRFRIDAEDALSA